MPSVFFCIWIEGTRLCKRLFIQTFCRLSQLRGFLANIPASSEANGSSSCYLHELGGLEAPQFKDLLSLTSKGDLQWSSAARSAIKSVFERVNLALLDSISDDFIDIRVNLCALLRE